MGAKHLPHKITAHRLENTFQRCFENKVPGELAGSQTQGFVQKLNLGFHRWNAIRQVFIFLKIRFRVPGIFLSP